MTDVTEPDRLVARLLREIDRAAGEGSPNIDRHPDEETLALFALGELRGPERDELVRHLSECAACRQAASSVLTWSELAESVTHPSLERSGSLWRPRRAMAWAGLAAAACLLLAFATLIRLDVPGRPGMATEGEAHAQATDLLQRGRFNEARAVVAEAVRHGIESDRLSSIEAQALRGIPGTIALAYAGRLTDFGFEIGGVTARSTAQGHPAGRAEEALGVLSRSGSEDDTIALNRGHALLSLQRPREALAEFQRVAGHTPGSALARLGEGLALFALADYSAAEDAFRACLRLDPEQGAARINLAMTLAEEGKTDEALAAWEEVLARSRELTDEERRAIRREVEELRAARQEPGSPPPSPAAPNKEPR
jgi:tetratricopeptide (TPR) repeat protein